MPVQTPYEDTAVSVERSQGTIRKRLQMVGALGVSFDEVWEEPRALLCEDVFLSFIEAPDGTTVGEAVIPVLRDGGRLQLGPAPRD
jgi:hypothetical protein